jgi:hypothetical protein
MKQWLEVTRFAYLKTPKVRWAIHNDVGGIFSNSGQYNSLKQLGKAFRTQYPDKSVLEMPVRIVTIEGYDANDKAVETAYDSYFAKVFGAD